ncbi:MAG: peroxide stress protein YaaA [Candidatus Ornithospirochaeta sp.]
MKIIISPAKKMKREECITPSSRPLFLEEAGEILSYLRSLSPEELSTVWKVKGKLLSSSLSSLKALDLGSSGSPALFSYDGIQYTYMSPSSFTDEMLSYAEEDLVILSGLYGALRPLDGIGEYRLEMESRIKIGGKESLYDFWGDKLASFVSSAGTLVNLASDEYSRAVLPHLGKNVEVVTPVFLEKCGDKFITKGVYAKMARGEMVRFLCENNIRDKEGIKAFSLRGYRFSPSLSKNGTYAFVR